MCSAIRATSRLPAMRSFHGQTRDLRCPRSLWGRSIRRTCFLWMSWSTLSSRQRNQHHRIQCHRQPTPPYRCSPRQMQRTRPILRSCLLCWLSPNSPIRRSTPRSCSRIQPLAWRFPRPLLRLSAPRVRRSLRPNHHPLCHAKRLRHRQCREPKPQRARTTQERRWGPAKPARRPHHPNSSPPQRLRNQLHRQPRRRRAHGLHRLSLQPRHLPPWRGAIRRRPGQARRYLCRMRDLSRTRCPYRTRRLCRTRYLYRSPRLQRCLLPA